MTKKVLNVIRFDKKDKRNDNVLQLCNELVVINGKSQREILEKISDDCCFVEVDQKNVM